MKMGCSLGKEGLVGDIIRTKDQMRQHDSFEYWSISLFRAGEKVRDLMAGFMA
jgi:hypothetical protein